MPNIMLDAQQQKLEDSYQSIGNALAQMPRSPGGVTTRLADWMRMYPPQTTLTHTEIRYLSGAELRVAADAFAAYAENLLAQAALCERSRETQMTEVEL